MKLSQVAVRTVSAHEITLELPGGQTLSRVLKHGQWIDVVPGSRVLPLGLDEITMVVWQSDPGIVVPRHKHSQVVDYLLLDGSVYIEIWADEDTEDLHSLLYLDERYRHCQIGIGRWHSARSNVPYTLLTTYSEIVSLEDLMGPLTGEDDASEDV